MRSPSCCRITGCRYATCNARSLTIDELQNLHLAKTGGKESMLNFFLHLVNNIGIPVVFIGTNSMVSLFSDVMRVARRSCGGG